MDSFLGTLEVIQFIWFMILYEEKIVIYYENVLINLLFQ